MSLPFWPSVTLHPIQNSVWGTKMQFHLSHESQCPESMHFKCCFRAGQICALGNKLVIVHDEVRRWHTLENKRPQSVIWKFSNVRSNKAGKDENRTSNSEYFVCFFHNKTSETCQKNRNMKLINTPNPEHLAIKYLEIWTEGTDIKIFYTALNYNTDTLLFC